MDPKQSNIDDETSSGSESETFITSLSKRDKTKSKKKQVSKDAKAKRLPSGKQTDVVTRLPSNYSQETAKRLPKKGEKEKRPLVYDASKVNQVILGKVKKIWNLPKKRYGFLEAEGFPNNIFFYHHDFIKAICPFDSVKEQEALYAAIVLETHGSDQEEKIFARCISRDKAKTEAAFRKYQLNEFKRKNDPNFVPSNANSNASSFCASGLASPHMTEEPEMEADDFDIPDIPPLVLTSIPKVKQTISPSNSSHEERNTADSPPISKQYHGDVRSVNHARKRAQIIDVTSKKEYQITQDDLHDSFGFDELHEGMKVTFSLEDGFVTNIRKSSILSREELNVENARLFILGKKVEMTEGFTTEFKALENDELPRDTDPTNFTFPGHVERYVTGFLNARVAGQLFFGIRDGGEVCGTRIGQEGERKQIDRIQGSVLQILRGVQPKVDAMMYDVLAHPIYEQIHGGYRKVEKRWVVEIAVKEYTGEDLYVTSGKYSEDRRPIAYHRQGQCTLFMDALTAFNKGKEVILKRRM